MAHFHLIKTKHDIKDDHILHISLSTPQSAYPMQNIAQRILLYVKEHDVKLPHMNLYVLKEMQSSTRDRPFGRIPCTLVLQAMEYISIKTGIYKWYIDRYLPGIYFPVEKFLRTVPKLNTEKDIDIYLRIPKKKTFIKASDTDYILSLLAIENFALSKKHASAVGHYKHLFIDTDSPYLIPRDIDKIYTLIVSATPQHAKQALSVLDKPCFLGGLIAATALKKEKIPYIKKVLHRYIEEDNYFLTAYHLIESTLTTEEIFSDKDILKYAILALGYTRLLGTYGKTLLNQFHTLGIKDPLLLLMLSVIMEGTNIDIHPTLWESLWKAYNTSQGHNKVYAAYGIINMVHFTRHSTDIRKLIEKNPIPEDIPLHIKVHLLRILSRHLGKAPDIDGATEKIRDTIEDISGKEGFKAFEGHLIRSLATALMMKEDVSPRVSLTMYWQAIGLDIMHSSSSFGHWLITTPYAGIPYSTVKHTFTSITSGLKSVFRPKEAIYLYGAMAESALLYGREEDFHLYLDTIRSLIPKTKHVIAKNIYFRLLAMEATNQEKWNSLEDILRQWQSYGVVPYFTPQWETMKIALEIAKGKIDLPSLNTIKHPLLVYISGKYIKDKQYDAIATLRSMVRKYTQSDNILKRAITHTYLYRLLKDIDASDSIEHALTARFLYDEIEGIAPQDILEETGGLLLQPDNPYISTLVRRFREQNRLLEVTISAIGSSNKEDVMKHLLRGLHIPYLVAYGRYESNDTHIEATYSLIGDIEELNIPDIDDYVITEKPSTVTVTYKIGDRKLLIYAEHRYADGIFDLITVKTIRRFASIIVDMLDGLTIVEKAKFDSLTGIHSRWFLTEDAPRMWNRTLKDGHSISIIFMDIDNFKYVNDIYGHAEGDKVLKTVASIIMEEIRISDRAIRYGGDEFLIILPYSNTQSALKVAQRIKEKIKNHLMLTHYMITLSIGIYTVSSPDIPLEKAIENADKAMYLAKNNGKNRIEIYYQ